jgi:hypothetical protein
VLDFLQYRYIFTKWVAIRVPVIQGHNGPAGILPFRLR